MLVFVNALKNTQPIKELMPIKKYRSILCLLLAVIFTMTLLAGCNKAASESDSVFSYSDGIDDNGYWSGIKALDYIDIFDYNGMIIPSGIHKISDDDIQAKIDYILSEHSSINEVTDRAIIDGDTVNIDYVGSVDGVEFDGGSTDGGGTDVTAGSTDYIDDFLIQIIGHIPGETINVEVTFPDDYHETSLQGKDAVFVTTINYIVDTMLPELTDEFVETTLSASYGWTTVAKMKEEIQKDLQKSALEEYIMDYIIYEVTAHSVPDKLMEYQVKVMQDYYQSYADDYSMELSDFLSSYVGASNMDELIESSQEDNMNNAKYSLVAQAIAEDAGITADTEDVVTFFVENMETSDYSSYEEEYGLPYLMQAALQHNVIEFVIENAVLE